ncbi:MAG: hypothetical protein ACOC2L_03000, partial [Candidatus Sumerlaeota bacterium]
AFALCNFLVLEEATGEDRFARLGFNLIDHVHRTLGRYREDDDRDGWISGLDEEFAREHPTAGGLRIGKPLPERAPDEPFDDAREWQSDGQYFHYLTKWMLALDIAGRRTGQERYSRWACELCEKAADAFVYKQDGDYRMHWKMSTDLSRPLVPSMGQHDPLDGYVTARELRSALDRSGSGAVGDDLDSVCDRMKQMLRSIRLVTTDTLGIGGLLMDATRLAQLIDGETSNDYRLLIDLLDSALAGLRTVADSRMMQMPAARRLAFRELGMAIGLEGVRIMREYLLHNEKALGGKEELMDRLEKYTEYIPSGENIRDFWLKDANRQFPGWTEHRDINAVMLATTILPGGVLFLPEHGEQ